MTVILNPDVPFEQLIEDIGKKIQGEFPVLGFHSDDSDPGGAYTYTF